MARGRNMARRERRVTVTVYIYTVTISLLYICTIINKLCDIFCTLEAQLQLLLVSALNYLRQTIQIFTRSP